MLADLHSQQLISKQAASSAHAQATHTESVAESRYDTLGLEQAYLAHGQSVRAQEFALEMQSITKLQQLVLNSSHRANDTDLAISLGAIVKLKPLDEKNQPSQKKADYFFILPIKGGASITINHIDVRLISNNSPLGSGLLGKYTDEHITINRQRYQIQEIL